jgi:hypothetical protein
MTIFWCLGLLFTNTALANPDCEEVIFYDVKEYAGEIGTITRAATLGELRPGKDLTDPEIVNLIGENEAVLRELRATAPNQGQRRNLFNRAWKAFLPLLQFRESSLAKNWSTERKKGQMNEAEVNKERDSIESNLHQEHSTLRVQFDEFRSDLSNDSVELETEDFLKRSKKLKELERRITELQRSPVRDPASTQVEISQITKTMKSLTDHLDLDTEYPPSLSRAPVLDDLWNIKQAELEETFTHVGATKDPQTGAITRPERELTRAEKAKAINQIEGHFYSSHAALDLEQLRKELKMKKNQSSPLLSRLPNSRREIENVQSVRTSG